MSSTDWLVICLSYIVSLLMANAIAWQPQSVSQLWWLGLGWSLLGLGAIAIKFVLLKQRIPIRTIVSASVVAILGTAYFQLRIPQPQNDDVSYQVTASTSEIVTLTGTVITEPRLNASRNLKLMLNATAIAKSTGIGIQRETVSGKVYTTLPLLQGTGIYPGQKLQLTGLLYLPQSATSGSFDFRQYLARRGVFTGLQGKSVDFMDRTEPRWGWWKLRRRIIRSQLRGLSSPWGQLVSSMVLGRKAVDLSPELRDRFVRVGLAHILAASGFHVSLLLGIILKLTENMTARLRLTVGITTLVMYLGLTGIQPSVLRACLMGSAVLLSLTIERKVKPLGLLLLVATAILLFNPLSIGDLGFQLSFLATFGLIVSLPSIQAKLDWLPPTIATLIGVPLAATIWVLPLLAYRFHTLSTYSLVINVICTPLITVISLGGMISAIAASVLPGLGSAIASVLYYPVALLVAIVNFFADLPGGAWAVGQVSLLALLLTYGLLLLIWLNKWFRQRWWTALCLIVVLISIQTFNNSTRLQITVLAAGDSPVIAIQDRSAMILINSGRRNYAKYVVTPFLAQQGINAIDYGIALDRSSNSKIAWQEIYQRAKVKYILNPIDRHYLLDAKIETYPALRGITTESAEIDINEELAVVEVKIAGARWLIVGTSPADSQAKIARYVRQHNLTFQQLTIVWSGKIDPTWLELIKPQMAIATAKQIEPQTLEILRRKQIELHNTLERGTVRWTPQAKFVDLQSDLD